MFEETVSEIMILPPKTCAKGRTVSSSQEPEFIRLSEKYRIDQE
jgi:hypothetical protein